MVLITEEIRAKAQIVHGDEICQEKTQLLLKEVGLPNGLLPLKDIIECGYVEETGFVWLKQKKKIEHKFEKVGRMAIYGTEVTAYAEKHKIKKLTGVKVKELMVWLNLGEIYVEDPNNGKITFKATTGLFRIFPSSAFVIEGVKEIKGSSDGKEIKLFGGTKDVKDGMPVKELKEAMILKE